MKIYTSQEIAEYSYGLNYTDIVIVPQYSEIKTRRDVDTSIKLGDLSIKVPIIGASMDTICEKEMCVALWKCGAIGAMHRFMSIEENVNQFTEMNNSNSVGFVCLGVNEDSKVRAKELYNVGARYFLIDIAFAHSVLMKNMISWLKKEFKDIFIVAGNIGTPEAVKDLEEWGADAIKIGLSGGRVCTTKQVTGIESCMVSLIAACSAVASVPIISDGGIRSSGDITKSIGLGADLCMTGFLLAGTDECPPVVKYNKQKEELDKLHINEVMPTYRYQSKMKELLNSLTYHGMASESAMKKIKTEEDYIPTPEGTEIQIELKGSVRNIIDNIAGGLRSSMSYCGANNIKEFQQKIKFGIKHE